MDEEFQAVNGLVLLISAPLGAGYSDLKNVSHQNYFSWLYERILHRRFIADPHLLPNTVESLKRTFRDVKGETTQQDAQASLAIDWLLQTFYDDLPKSIQEELRGDEDFMVSFGLEFIQAISIDDLSFEVGVFFEAAQKAINGHKSTVSPIRDQTEIIFEPIENELALRFTHPVTSKEIKVMDERFILLLDSPVKREKFLYQQRHWFDCSEVETQEAIASIAVAEGILRRIEIADKWRESSASVYYENLYHIIREKKPIDFSNLIPPNADRLVTHYRLLLPSDRELDFSEALATASELLLKEEGLRVTIHRLVGFPTPLPISVLNTISSLPDAEINALVKSLLRQAGSPLSKIHLLRILSHLGDENASYYRLARRITKRFFKETAIAEFTAFSVLLRWVHQEFGYWPDANKWQTHLQLAMVWAHTHQLFSLMTAAGVAIDWITETFKRLTTRLPSEMFDTNLSQWLDVVHPRLFNFPAFILTGLSYSVDKKGSQVFDQILEEFFNLVAFQEVNGVLLPTPPLFRDMSQAPNRLESFLGGNYSEKLIHLLGKDRTNVFDSKTFQTLASQALDELAKKPDDLSALLTLQVIISNLPPYDSLTGNLSLLLTQTHFVILIEQSLEQGLAVMEFAAMQAVHLANEDLNQHLKIQFLQAVEQLAQQDRNFSNLQDSDIDSLYGTLLEIAFNIATCSQTTNEKILLFRDLLSQMVDLWPKIIPTVKPIVQKLCEELPVKQGQHFEVLLLRLRAE